jgi:hypothetical protein
MVTIDGPALVLQQLEASDRRKPSTHPELLDHFARQDERLFDLLLRYRAGEQVLDGIVAELLPAVHAKADRLNAPRLYGRDDLRQELIAEIIYVARRLPLPRPGFVTRRLMLAASRRLTRRLEREWYRQLEELYRELDGRLLAGSDDAETGGEE